MNYIHYFKDCLKYIYIFFIVTKKEGTLASTWLPIFDNIVPRFSIWTSILWWCKTSRVFLDVLWHKLSKTFIKSTCICSYIGLHIGHETPLNNQPTLGMVKISHLTLSDLPYLAWVLLSTSHLLLPKMRHPWSDSILPVLIPTQPSSSCSLIL